jgi:hypothetical protein
MDEQEMGERRHVVTRKRRRTQQRGNDTQREEDYQQRPEAPATRRQGEVLKAGAET